MNQFNKPLEFAMKTTHGTILTALAFLFTTMVAQAIDIPKEKQENPAGGSALVCAAIGMVEIEEAKPNTKEYNAIRTYVEAVAFAGEMAYGSRDVFVWKSTAATLDLKNGLQQLKNSDYSAYATRRAELSKTKQTCVGMYQWIIDLKSK